MPRRWVSDHQARPEIELGKGGERWAASGPERHGSHAFVSMGSSTCWQRSGRFALAKRLDRTGGGGCQDDMGVRASSLKSQFDQRQKGEAFADGEGVEPEDLAGRAGGLTL